MSELVQRVRSRLAEDGASGAGGPGLDRAVRAASGAVVDDAVLEVLRREVTAELAGAGPLDALLALPGVTDVLVNAPDAVWFDRGCGMERAGVGFRDDAAVRRLAQRLAACAGRRLDDAQPFADVCLPDGTRLHAVLPPLAANTTLSLRVLRRRRHGIDDLVRAGTIRPGVAELLRAVIEARLSFLLSGGTGTGKTTLLAALMNLVPADERLLVIEDEPELPIEHPHCVRLCGRPPNVEGAGAVGVRELVRQALRMRPDRLVVGEFRGAETLDLLLALNTGHEGGAATLHANSARDVPARLAALTVLAGQPAAAATWLVSGALHLVVHLRYSPQRRRLLSDIGLLDVVEGRLVVADAWSERRGTGPAAPRLAALLAEREVATPELLGARPRQ